MSNPLRQRALRLLAQREHARAELKRKLAPHAEANGHSEEQLEALLDDLVARRLLSDARYAEMRVSVRGSRYGNARLAQELKQTGVAPEEAAVALAEAGDELARARSVWIRKFSALPTEASERAKQIRFLMSRGFSSDTIRRVLRGEAAEEREEE
ncbi:MAG: recombination regulator RecX [Betaproteobacteria bacterium]|jgi:regulatory protein|uniref:Regulatory protein RecX n=1 Tax=Candidatus Proximibacter danicus TaxID=2954365 RepID=A0A9D7K3N7_9PROT|nr:recombination regulator RecX [Candidatus Proximibacter danicus]MBK9447131.1 recombination regulator RecX [Betaproteobacteria bacterium]